MSYSDFIAGKLALRVPTGIPDAEVDSPHLFDFQRDLTRWALRRGRAAIFASMGLGKSRMQIVWSQHVVEHTGLPVLVLAPLAVAHQTQGEGETIGIVARVVKSGAEVTGPGIYITNYDRLHLFDASVFGGVVLDESSIIKHATAATFIALCAAFARTPFKLCCTATPSPNDYTELGTHAEFLGVCSRVEMLAEYFTHDGGNTSQWRLKGHARDVFWRFVATWGALVRSPADLGYDGSAYELPPLEVTHHVLESTDESCREAGLLFPMPAASLMERRRARRASVGERVAACAELANAEREPWVVWAVLNDESAALTKAIDGAVEVTGSMASDDKERALMAFLRGDARVLVSKSSIAGFGLNMQCAARMAFVGIDDSYEGYFQAVGRCHRFGQKRAVHVHLFSSALEGAVWKNLQRKAADAQRMSEELARESADAVRAEVRGIERRVNEYQPQVKMRLPSWL